MPHDGLGVDDLNSMFTRLQTVKKAEILCGIKISRDDAIKLKDDDFIETIQDAFEHLLPLYQLN
ncbi:MULTISPECIES: DUF1054 family protein [Bacillaceae]|uniref:DUF1054 family protein n=1 Tax=Bacillaceae TaxID=186817 RepID=UPI001293E279|nr:MULTISPECIES: DUF1054 family protein [Bacillaceae]